jgi:hypothetical protein
MALAIRTAVKTATAPDGAITVEVYLHLKYLNKEMAIPVS